METINLSVNINASKQAAWDLLADYGNPHKYVKGIVDAHITSTASTGIGAVRHCDLPSMMGMKQYIVEKITHWKEGESYSYVITDTAAPIKDCDVTWTVTGDAQQSTIAVNITYRTKGVMGFLMKGMLRKEFPRQLTAGLDDMKVLLEAKPRLAAA